MLIGFLENSRNFLSGQYAHDNSSTLFLSIALASDTKVFEGEIFPVVSFIDFPIFAPISSRFVMTVFAESSSVSILPFNFQVLTRL